VASQIVRSDDLKIRSAEPGDAAALAQFAEESFRDAFERFNSAEDMASYVASAFDSELQRTEIADVHGAVLLVESAEGIVGYAQLLLAACPSEVEARPAMELQRFYVARDHHGSGVAQRLMHAALEVAAEHGAAAIWLGVWARNARAISFYRKVGFVDAGSKSFVLGMDLQTDRIMWRPVSD
jgi:ribosomal protein S18 acetylase RimI-like enzyme